MQNIVEGNHIAATTFTSGIWAKILLIVVWVVLIVAPVVALPRLRATGYSYACFWARRLRHVLADSSDLG